MTSTSNDQATLERSGSSSASQQQEQQEQQPHQQQQQQHSHSTTPTGRRLYGQVSLWQDWEEEAVDSTPKYWELFADLLLVAAASSMADNFQSKQTWFGFLEFVFLYSVIMHGWIMYTHHYTSRFLETSLFHTCILFFYLLGMAGTIVNASLETAHAFSIGVLVQRAAFLAMVAQIIAFLPRARWFAITLGTAVLVSMSMFIVTAIVNHDRHDDNVDEGNKEDNDETWNQEHVTIACWLVAAFFDNSLELFMLSALSTRSLVPVNIDHSKDRLGVLVLVMMGETVISATISYRAHVEKGIGLETNQQLYEVLTYSFLLVFMFTLLYFHVQPHPEDHAFRRSRLTGFLCLALTKVLGLTLLLVGVCIKLSVRAVAEGTKMSTFSRSLLNMAVGGSMMLLLGIRCCHYLGRLPRPSHPPNVRRLMWTWWAFMGIACSVCFFFPQWDGAPLPPLIVSSVWLLMVCIIDSSFTHFLEAKHLMVNTELPEEGMEQDEGGGMHDETAFLIHPADTNAQTSFYVGCPDDN